MCPAPTWVSLTTSPATSPHRGPSQCGAVSILQDCFKCTNWQVFREAATGKGGVDLEEYVSSVCGYISKCVDDVTTTRKITVCTNQKPWLNGEVQSLLKVVALRAAKRELQAGIKRAKATYALRIEGHFPTTDPCSMWKGIKSITNYKGRNTVYPRYPSLPDALNTFYARFESCNSSVSTRLILTPGEPLLSVSAEDVRWTLQRINPCKAAGSTLTSSITVWYSTCSAADRKALKREVNSAQKITNCSLPSFEDIYVNRCRSRPHPLGTWTVHPAPFRQ